MKKIQITLTVEEGKDISIGGLKDSLEECEAICDNCIKHIGCGYKSQIL